MCFVLFKYFFDANTAREFLQNSSNFKETEKNNFSAKWFKNEEEKEFPEIFKSKISKIVQKYNENNMKNYQNLNMLNPQQQQQLPQQQSNYNFYPQNWPNQVPQMNMMGQQGNLMMNDPQMAYNNMNNNNQNKQNNINNHNNNSNNNNLPQYNGINGNNMMNPGNPNNPNFNNVNLANGRKNSTNSNAENEDRKNQQGQQQQNGKFTCRFELQIENDKEFQVARRLIGAKVNFFIFFFLIF